MKGRQDAQPFTATQLVGQDLGLDGSRIGVVRGGQNRVKVTLDRCALLSSAEPFGE